MATALSYPTISGVSSPPYISALSETANIQNTINFLYYGSADSGTTPRTSQSSSSGIYGMLLQLQTQISAVSSGINVHESAKFATATTLAATYAAGTSDASGGTGIGATITFSSTGVQKIDSTTVNLALNDRVLVKDGVTADSGTTSKANGVYYVSTLPTSGVAGILTRAEDSNNSIAGEMAEGDFLYISEGDTNANKAWILTTTGATGTGPAGSIKIGTDNITFTQFIGVGSYYIGTTTAQISPTSGQALSGVVWNGTEIGPTYGGTNQTSYAKGDLLYASATNTLSKLSISPTDGYVLTANSTSGLPEWRASSGGGGSFTGGTLTSNLTLAAGTTSLSPITFQSGTNLTAVTAGANEYDGTVFYKTSNTTPGRALATQNYYYVTPSAGYVLTMDSNTTSSILGGVTTGITLAAGTTYDVELLVNFQHTYGGDATRTFTQSWTATGVSGSPTVSFNYVIDYGSNTTSFATASTLGTSLITSPGTSVTISASISSGSRYVVYKVKGILRITGTGSIKFYPQLTVNSLLVGNAATIGAGSYIKLTPIGNGTVTSVGTWN
jgi:hypothetical protein